MNLKQLTSTVNQLYFNNTSSYKTIASIEKELLAIVGGSIDIKKINNKIINKYITKLRENGNKSTTINNKLMYLSKVLSYAVKNQLIDYKPYIPTFKIKATKDVILTKDDIEIMTAYAIQNQLTELYQVIIIGYNTGIRISNILNIKPEDVDNGYIRIYENKTNNPYSIPMNKQVLEVIKNFKPFTLNYRQIEYQFKTMIRKLNMDARITIHTLRHSTCSKLVKEGVPLPVVQALMNHKNIQTTMRYNHLKNEQLENAVSVL